MALPLNVPNSTAGVVDPNAQNPFAGMTFQLVPMQGAGGQVGPAHKPTPTSPPMIAQAPGPDRGVMAPTSFMQNNMGFMNNLGFGGSGPVNPYGMFGLRGGMLGGIPKDMQNLFPMMAK